MRGKTLRRLRAAMLLTLTVLLVAPLVYVVVDIKFSHRGWWAPGPVARYFNESIEAAMRAAHAELSHLYSSAGADATYAEGASIITLMVALLCVLVVALRLKKRTGKNLRESAKALWQRRT